MSDTAYYRPAAAMPVVLGMQYHTTASGLSARHIVSAAGTNAAAVKATAGKVLGWSLANLTPAWRHVKLHNTPTPAAGVGVARTISIPPNGVASFFSEGGITFTTAIGISIVAGASDTDATAVGVADVVGELFWA
jgi:hypothetical protein